MNFKQNSLNSLTPNTMLVQLRILQFYSSQICLMPKLRKGNHHYFRWKIENTLPESLEIIVFITMKCIFIRIYCIHSPKSLRLNRLLTLICRCKQHQHEPQLFADESRHFGLSEWRSISHFRNSTNSTCLILSY